MEFFKFTEEQEMLRKVVREFAESRQRCREPYIRP
ncbi:MAG: hypothetical protein PWQ67_1587 [Clostridia bacterium]|nr:hypothetical protein [Clostridia bacterium]MDN5323133.1 hypothetical protein [Clostridia bacterium]